MNQEFIQQFNDQEAVKAIKPLNFVIWGSLLYLVTFIPMPLFDKFMPWQLLQIVFAILMMYGVYGLYKLDFSDRYRRSISLSYLTTIVFIMSEIDAALGNPILEIPLLDVIFSLASLYAIFAGPFHFIHAMMRMCEQLEKSHLVTWWKINRIVLIVSFILSFLIFLLFANTDVSDVSSEGVIRTFYILIAIGFVPSIIMLIALWLTRRTTQQIKANLEFEETIA